MSGKSGTHHWRCNRRVLSSKTCYFVTVCIALFFVLFALSNLEQFTLFSKKLETTGDDEVQRAISRVFRYPVDKFQPVFEVSSPAQILVYSVWYDERFPEEVRVVALGRDMALPNMQQLLCVYYRLNASTPNDVHASEVKFASLPTVEKPITLMDMTTGDHKGFLTINCEAADNMTSYNWWLSIVPVEHRGAVLNYKPVIQIKIRKNRQRFGVCVQPFNRKYSNPLELIQMIELNRILGAQYFYFYVHSVSAQVSKVLNYYATQTDFVEVLPWSFEAGWLNVGLFGQYGALADCLRRVLQHFEYFVYVDVDEFIIPRTFKTWNELYDNFLVKFNASQYLFGNVYYLRKKSETKSDAENLHLTSLVSTERYMETLSNGERAKVMAVSECVSVHHIHVVKRFLPLEQCENTTFHVDPRIAFLHHYRFATANLPDEKLLIEDHYVLNTYKEELIKNVREAMANIDGGRTQTGETSTLTSSTTTAAATTPTTRTKTFTSATSTTTTATETKSSPNPVSTTATPPKMSSVPFNSYRNAT